MKLSSVFSPEGFIMLSIGFFLDFFNVLAVALYAAFGIGAVFEKINYVVGFILITTWQFYKLGERVKSSRGKAQERLKKYLQKFTQKRIGWLIFKFIPIIGNLRFWTYDIIETFKAIEQMKAEEQEEMMAMQNVIYLNQLDDEEDEEQEQVLRVDEEEKEEYAEAA